MRCQIHPQVAAFLLFALYFVTSFLDMFSITSLAKVDLPSGRPRCHSRCISYNGLFIQSMPFDVSVGTFSDPRPAVWQNHHSSPRHIVTLSPTLYPFLVNPPHILTPLLLKTLTTLCPVYPTHSPTAPVAIPNVLNSPNLESKNFSVSLKSVL